MVNNGYRDMIGLQVGELLVIRHSHRHKRHHMWVCKCSCGKETTVAVGNLNKQTTKSCGCKNIERSKKNGKHFFTHGHWNHPLYNTYKSMCERCDDPKNISYKYYGAKGITVCKEWRNFEQFLQDIGPKPTKFHTIERKDNNKNYCKDNCC
jgi:hypothetical protein